MAVSREEEQVSDAAPRATAADCFRFAGDLTGEMEVATPEGDLWYPLVEVVEWGESQVAGHPRQMMRLTFADDSVAFFPQDFPLRSRGRDGQPT